jgi:thymidylate synthase (FAD)
MTDVIFRHDVVARNKDHMGGDESIIEAMLVSSDKDQLVEEMLDIPKTEGRIRFLMRKKHGTPFEHNALKFYVEAPIFVFREWHRHRIGWSYNEQSGRYSELPPMFYIPPLNRPLKQVGKPGNYTYVPGTQEEYMWLQHDMRNQAISQYISYQERLKRGIAKEVARMSLGVNIYSKMYATCNARSLMAFLELRTN